MTNVVFRSNMGLHTDSTKYDLTIAALGYETRATYISSRTALPSSRKLAWPFPDHHILSYGNNYRWFIENGYSIIGDQIESVVSEIRAYAAINRKLFLSVDISCMTRERLAVILEECCSLATRQSVTVDIRYAPAKFLPPSDESEQNTSAGPVLPSLSGWSPDPSERTVLLVGLGYEQDKAVGVVEYLEPAKVVAFIPQSSEVEYTPALEAANELLWALRPPVQREVYNIEEPLGLGVLLDGMVFRYLQQDFRPVLLPFGPKIFAAVAMLVAQRQRAAAVWRVSAGAGGTPHDRIASGRIAGVRVEYLPED